MNVKGQAHDVAGPWHFHLGRLSHPCSSPPFTVEPSLRRLGVPGPEIYSWGCPDRFIIKLQKWHTDNNLQVNYSRDKFGIHKTNSLGGNFPRLKFYNFCGYLFNLTLAYENINVCVWIKQKWPADAFIPKLHDSESQHLTSKVTEL